jgi:hypothetical protein
MNAEHLATGIIGLIVVILAMILAIFWLIFPWVVYAQLRAIVREQKRTNNLLTALLAQTAEPVPGSTGGPPVPLGDSPKVPEPVYTAEPPP